MIRAVNLLRYGRSALQQSQFKSSWWTSRWAHREQSNGTPSSYHNQQALSSPIHTSLAHLHVKPPIVIAEVYNKRNRHDPASLGQGSTSSLRHMKRYQCKRNERSGSFSQNFSWEIGYSTSDNQGLCCERANFLLAKTRREGEKRLSR